MPRKEVYWRDPDKYREKSRVYMSSRREQNNEANRRWRKKKSKDMAFRRKDAERSRQYRLRKKMAS